jgi:ABC-type Na+ transport system ATPase subunit NatA
LKKLPIEWEKTFASYTFDQELITSIYWKLKKLNSLKINDIMKKRVNELSRPFSKKKVQMAKNHMKNAQHPWS